MSVATLDKPAVEEAAIEPKPAERLVIISCSGDLEKVWAAYIIATTGAAMGKDVMIFHTFWGFMPLVRDEVASFGKNWMQKMLSRMNRGGISHLKLAKLNFGGAGKAMLMHLASEQRDASPRDLQQMARDLGVRLVPCQMSMDLMGITRDDLIEGVEEPVGAASMLAEAQGAITLFI
jgi:peroxiredoxin family protein